MSASSALQKAILDALQADVTLAGMVGDRIYDVPPGRPRKPYVSLGPTSFFPERRDCMNSRTETVQIDVWTEDKERRQLCKAICDAVVAVLDQADLSLDDPYALGRCDLLLARIMDDPDDITRHGVLQFECEVTG
jgi:predicted transcriptional regulator